jgi:hypothetical protein
MSARCDAILTFAAVAMSSGSNWQLWFVQLSGWPVFLLVVAVTVLFMLAASVVLTWLGNKSVLHSMLLALLALAVLVMLLLIGAAFFGRTA